MQAILLLAPVVVLTFVAQNPQPSAASQCAIAEDAAYAFTREQPVQVGGGAMYLAARERRYLDALRGPAGEALRYRRTASLEGSDQRTILDRYEVTYDGLEKPVMLYVDGYHYDDAVKAPRGFTCAVPIALNPPPPDAFLAMDSLIGLAIEQGAVREVAPISLDADGSSRHGIILDQFRMIARAARSAASAGHPLDPKTRSPEITRAKTVVIAYPFQCDGRSVAPAAVDFIAAQGASPRREGDYTTGETLGRLLPGMNLPAGALAATYLLEKPRPADSVRIVYPDGACGASNEITLQLTHSPARPLQTPSPTLPAGHPPTDRVVRLQALIDLEGATQRVVYQGGPATLTQSAIDGVRAWTAEPARINGAPVVTPVTLQVKFQR